MRALTHEEFELLVAKTTCDELIEAMASASALGMALARFQNAIDALVDARKAQPKGGAW